MLDLETPIPVVDLARLESNLDKMAAYAKTHNLGLRPHVKTHKTPWIGAEQTNRGAIGLTCATPREAEVMRASSNNILLAYPPIGPTRARRVASIPGDTRLTVSLDSKEAIESLAEACRAGQREAHVLIEVDLGMHRVGVTRVEDAIELARLATKTPPLHYAGIAFYPGHVRQPVHQQDASLEALNNGLSAVIEAFDRAGLAPAIVSGGSTPTAWRSHELKGVTEIRPGTYVYNDRGTVAIGSCEWDECALTVLATVVSTAVQGQAVIDAGTKSLGREPILGGDASGLGALMDRPDVIVKSTSEEHGLLDLSKTTWRPKVGEQVRVVPNHVCIVVHLFDDIAGLRGDVVEKCWKVEARGRT